MEAGFHEARWEHTNPLGLALEATLDYLPATLAGLVVGRFIKAPVAVCPAGKIQLPPHREVEVTVSDRGQVKSFSTSGAGSSKLRSFWRAEQCKACTPQQAYTPLGPTAPGILAYAVCPHSSLLAGLGRVFVPRQQVSENSEVYRRARARIKRLSALCVALARATSSFFDIADAPHHLEKGGLYRRSFFERCYNPWTQARAGFGFFPKAETCAKVVLNADPDDLVAGVPKLRPRGISSYPEETIPGVASVLPSALMIVKDCVATWNLNELHGTEMSVEWGVGKSAQGLSEWFEATMRSGMASVIVGGDDSLFVDFRNGPYAINGDGSNFDGTVSPAWKELFIKELYEPILAAHPDQAMVRQVIRTLLANARVCKVSYGRRKEHFRVTLKGEGCRNSGEFDTTVGNTLLLNLAYLEWFERGDLRPEALTRVYEEFGLIPEIAKVPIESAEFYSCCIMPAEVRRPGGVWETAFVFSPLIGRQVTKFLAKYGSVRQCDVVKQRTLREHAMFLLASATPVLRGMAFDHSKTVTDEDIRSLDAFKSGLLRDRPTWSLRPTLETYYHFADRYNCAVEELRALEGFIRSNHDRPIVYTCDLLQRIFKRDMGHDLIYPPFQPPT
jgi:hypothetical protein